MPCPGGIVELEELTFLFLHPFLLAFLGFLRVVQRPSFDIAFVEGMSVGIAMFDAKRIRAWRLVRIAIGVLWLSEASAC